MTTYANLMDDRQIPQTEKLNERQVANHGGGFGFVITNLQRLRRFLILGSDSGTYYQSARKITRENAAVVEKCWVSDPKETAAMIEEVSFGGLAPKNDAAIFALALGKMSANADARSLAYALIPKVCRTGTHLFQLVATVKALGGGFGRGFKRAVGNWYLDKDLDKLAYQMVKYRSREGLTHENVLDMARPKPKDEAYDHLFKWAVNGEYEPWSLPQVVNDHLFAMAAEDSAALAEVLKGASLPWEALPTWANNDPVIQSKLLPDMGITALLRNLGRLTALGVIKPLSAEEDIVVSRLVDKEAIRKGRLHPLNILLAMKVYQSGRGVRSHGNGWTPVQSVVDALDSAFYLSMDLQEPTGKRYLLGVDVSDSMTWATSAINGVLQSREAASAMAMAISRTERSHITAFSAGIMPVDIGTRSRLDQVCRTFASFPADHTNCAAPMLYALQARIEVDVFVVLTDNETNSRGSMHPSAALKMYREKTGIPAKLAVLGMTATEISIADQSDAGMMDFVGFDASVPSLLRDFAAA